MKQNQPFSMYLLHFQGDFFEKFKILYLIHFHWSAIFSKINLRFLNTFLIFSSHFIDFLALYPTSRMIILGSFSKLLILSPYVQSKKRPPPLLRPKQGFGELAPRRTLKYFDQKYLYIRKIFFRNNFRQQQLIRI